MQKILWAILCRFLQRFIQKSFLFFFLKNFKISEIYSNYSATILSSKSFVEFFTNCSDGFLDFFQKSFRNSFTSSFKKSSQVSFEKLLQISLIISTIYFLWSLSRGCFRHFSMDFFRKLFTDCLMITQISSKIRPRIS